MNFTDSQQQAIDHLTGPAIVIAGPGAGKTRVITERVKTLLTNQNINPKNLLVTTFTEKAANELRIRLANTVGRKAERMHISTIHSFCKNMLEDYFQYHDYGAEINVIDEESQILILELNKVKFGYARWSSSNGRVIYIKKDYDFLSGVKSLYNKMTENNITPDTLIDKLGEEELLTEEDKKIIEGYNKYADYLGAEKKMDFAMLQSRFYNLLVVHPNVAEEIEKRFQFVLVDEYQDTSPIQDLIFEKLTKRQKNIFVVGDENQSIYGFRGANIENFRRFTKKYPKAKEYLLNVNFRSTKTIVKVSNEVFKEELRKALEAKRKNGNRIKLIYEDYSDNSAKATIKLIKELYRKKIIKSYGDVAFLFRSLKSHSEEFIHYLEEEKIPYITSGDGKFLEREEIQTMLLTLSYITNELYLDRKLADWSKWWRRDMFLTEMYDFSKSTKELIKDGQFKLYNLKSENDFTKAGFKNKRDINVLLKLNELRSEVESKERKKDDDENKSLSLEIFYKVLEISGYFTRLVERNSIGGKEKLRNLAQLSTIIRRYIEIRGKEDIKGFLWYIYNNQKNFDQEKIEDNNTVKLMTVHKAKGMEFPVVIVCCMNEGRFPLRYRGDGFVPIPEELLLRNIAEDEEILHFNEEKRLFYVAVTRAQDILILTGSDKHKVKAWKRSRFLDFIPKEMYCNDVTEKSEKYYTVSKDAPSMSYSAINVYLGCPLRYDFIYNYGFEYPQIFTQAFGLSIHNTLQKIHEKMRTGSKLNHDGISKLIDSNWIDLPIPKKRNENFKKSLRERFYAYYDDASTTYKEIVAIEEPFSYIDDNMIIKGKVDLIVKDTQDQTLLIDFKSRSLKGINKTNVDKQLQIYNHCLESEYNIDKLIAYAFFDNEKLEFPKDEKGTSTFLGEVSDKMKKEEFEKRISEFCTQCHFNFHCNKSE